MSGALLFRLFFLSSYGCKPKQHFSAYNNSIAILAFLGCFFFCDGVLGFGAHYRRTCFLDLCPIFLTARNPQQAPSHERRLLVHVGPWAGVFVSFFSLQALRKVENGRRGRCFSSLIPPLVAQETGAFTWPQSFGPDGIGHFPGLLLGYFLLRMKTLHSPWGWLFCLLEIAKGVLGDL